jgi:hypothetical protein
LQRINREERKTKSETVIALALFAASTRHKWRPRPESETWLAYERAHCASRPKAIEEEREQDFASDYDLERYLDAIEERQNAQDRAEDVE